MASVIVDENNRRVGLIPEPPLSDREWAGLRLDARTGLAGSYLAEQAQNLACVQVVARGFLKERRTREGIEQLAGRQERYRRLAIWRAV